MLRLFFTLSLIFITGCTTSNNTAPTTKPDLFAGRKGCFLLYNMKTKNFEKEIGGVTCQEQYPACSSFKVPLAVIAFDSGFLKDENQVLKWNGKKDVREVSNKDHNGKTWMQDSIVWFSQRVTSKLGQKKMQKYLDAFDYGNKNIAAGLTDSWLTSPASGKPALKISAYEQAEFMEKLWTDNLPASKEAMKLTREITYLETSPKGFKLSGKTGSNFYDKEQKTHFGWFIAHIQNADQEYVAITNISDLAPSNEPGYGGAKAKAIMKKYLDDAGLW